MGGIKDRGFASMSLADRKRIASLGGKAAHKKGTAHQWDRREAQVAGIKGGSVRGKQKGVRKRGGDV